MHRKCSQKRKTNMVTHIVMLHRGILQDTCALTVVVSLPLKFTRIAKHVRNHGGWTGNSNAMPTSRETELESRSHFHGNARTSRSKFAGLDRPTACTTKRWPHPKRSSWHHNLCRSKIELVGFCQSRLNMHADRIVARTRIYTHTEHKWLDNSRERFSRLNVVATTSRRLKTKANLMTHILTHQRVRCPRHMRQQRWSFHILQSFRGSRENVRMHGGCTNHSNTVPNLRVTQIRSRYSPERYITNMCINDR